MTKKRVIIIIFTLIAVVIVLAFMIMRSTSNKKKLIESSDTTCGCCRCGTYNSELKSTDESQDLTVQIPNFTSDQIETLITSSEWQISDVAYDREYGYYFHACLEPVANLVIDTDNLTKISISSDINFRFLQPIITQAHFIIGTTSGMIYFTFNDSQNVDKELYESFMNELKKGNIRAEVYIYARVNFDMQLVKCAYYKVYYYDSKLVLLRLENRYSYMFEGNEPEGFNSEDFIISTFRFSKSIYAYIKFLTNDSLKQQFVIVLPMNELYHRILSFASEFEEKGYFRKGFTMELYNVFVD